MVERELQANADYFKNGNCNLSLADVLKMLKLLTKGG
jgi:hypothetical protein